MALIPHPLASHWPYLSGSPVPTLKWLAREKLWERGFDQNWESMTFKFRVRFSHDQGFQGFLFSWLVAWLVGF